MGTLWSGTVIGAAVIHCSEVVRDQRPESSGPSERPQIFHGTTKEALYFSITLPPITYHCCALNFCRRLNSDPTRCPPGPTRRNRAASYMTGESLRPAALRRGQRGHVER